MKKIFTALLLSLTVFVTGCSANEMGNAISDQSLSTGLINNSSGETQTESQNPVISNSETTAEIPSNAPIQSSEKTDSTSEVVQSTNNSSEQSTAFMPSSSSIPQSSSTQTNTPSSSSSSSVLPTQSVPENVTTESISEPEPTEEDNMKTLVVFFSCTNTTKTLAEYAADILGADIYEIVPAEPYTEVDLAYYTNGRADREQNDPSVRPVISGGVDNMSDYDTIILGYPIWHGQAPRIISTFLESYDFSGKTIIPFCTSHSSGIGSSADNLHSLCSADWEEGRRFGGGATRDDIKEWLRQ